MSVHADPPPAVVREPKGLSYVTGSQLGKGGFAICYSAEACENGKKTGKIVALKIVRSQMEPPKLAQKFVTELQLHSKLRHSNIVEFYRAFSFGENTYVVLEICTNGSLADALRKRKFFTMPEIRRFVIQTCGAVKYLHHRNIIHRDLKTGNLFLDHNMNIKVGDFGLAAMLVSQNDIGARRTTMCGTPNYLAPEILEKTGRGHNEKVDLWAIGIIAYTLAVGKAPFHAAKREEIYKKLQNREYSWPEVSKFPSDISDDLKDLVSSLLVDEDDRPSPDHIVSHAFFKMAYIPETLTSSVLSEKPKWTIAPPTAETIQRGFSESWYRICKASGVGEYAPGRMFPLAGGKRIPSVIKDVEREIREGNVPIVPMPADVIYLPFPELNNLLQQKSRHLNDIVEERESSSNGGLAETTGNGRLNRPRSKVDAESVRLKENTRPEEIRVTEPITKAGTIKRVASRRVRKEEEVTATAPPVVERSTRQTVLPPPLTRTESAPAPIQEPVRELARNPTRRGRPARVDSGNTKPELTKEPPKSRVTLSRSNTETEVPKRSRTIPRTISPVEIPEVRPQKSLQSLPHRSRTPPTAASSTEPSHSSHVPHTNPEQVLERALQLRDNLVSALRARTGSSRRNTPEPSNLPFITKWVDYSRKLGIGYVLQDGSIGCILNATTKNPLTHVVVSNGLRALKDLQADPSSDIPLNLYEADNEGLKLTDAEPSRRKMIGQVWTKFARYMCQQLGDAEQDPSTSSRRGAAADLATKTVSPFVRFYERIDGVGIWGFSNGCYQLNFTDHTKMVLSSDGKIVSFTCLPLAATERLQAGDLTDMPYKYIKGRVVLEAPVTDLLHGSASSLRDAQIAQANLLWEKLSFFVNVVGKWKVEGGIGCSIESVADLRWEGPRLEEGKGKGSKVDWVSIGSIRV